MGFVSISSAPHHHNHSLLLCSTGFRPHAHQATMLSQFGALTVAQETQFGELPWDFVALVFLRLPVDARLRAREVSRCWRALLNEPRFWTVLDFSPGSGVVARLTRALLFAAGERGRRHLHTLDVTGAKYLPAEPLVQFAAVHGQSLRSVTAPEWPPLSANYVTHLCRSAPLCTLRCRVECTFAEAVPLLRCEAPCALLHVVRLLVHGFCNNRQEVRDFAAALPSHSGKIKVLDVSSDDVTNDALQNGAVADALVRGIAEAGVSDVSFSFCRFTPASLPRLARLLNAGCMHSFGISDNGDWQPVFEAGPELTTFCHALRSSTLQKLVLAEVELWQDLAASGELLAALVNHPTLKELSLPDFVGATDDTRRAAGKQLAPFVTHSSALQKLELTWNQIGEAGLAPIFEALHFSSTFKELIVDHEDISHEFARDVILPAVRANTSLRRLNFRYDDEYYDEKLLPELVEAHIIVAARTQPDDGATDAA